MRSSLSKIFLNNRINQTIVFKIYAPQKPMHLRGSPKKHIDKDIIITSVPLWNTLESQIFCQVYNFKIVKSTSIDAYLVVTDNI